MTCCLRNRTPSLFARISCHTLRGFFRWGHFAAQFFCAFQFCLGDWLIRNDVFRGHGGIVLQNKEQTSPQPSPKGEGAKPSPPKALANPRGLIPTSRHPFPPRSAPAGGQGRGRGIGPSSLPRLDLLANWHESLLISQKIGAILLSSGIIFVIF
jgi:hypothetical protein